MTQPPTPKSRLKKSLFATCTGSPIKRTSPVKVNFVHEQSTQTKINTDDLDVKVIRFLVLDITMCLK